MTTGQPGSAGPSPDRVDPRDPVDPVDPVDPKTGATFRESRVLSAEGFPLAVFDHRPPVAGAPTLVLAHGLGGNLITWRHLIRELAPHYRIATWDYRGLYASRFDPALRARAAHGEVPLDLLSHADDARRVLDALGIDRAIFVGWSMGVQLNFELARQGSPTGDRVAGLIQICGAPGRTLTTTLLGRTGMKLIPPAMDLMRAAAERHAPWLARVAGSPQAMQFAKVVGLVAPSIDEALAAEIVRDYVRLDFDVYNRILMSLADHDASDVLPTLGVPTLLVAGTKDPMTPHTISERMAKAIPGAELVVVRGASHYLPVEFPDTLNQAVSAFLGRSFGVPPAA
ncbi:MAG: alpha/beta hydrolase [Deltaproteobacteria bacterium]|nr:alpha/beta hydrolase [Deltaproteobacteria bacterium]